MTTEVKKAMGKSWSFSLSIKLQKWKTSLQELMYFDESELVDVNRQYIELSDTMPCLADPFL